jgi:hypothetical protein
MPIGPGKYDALCTDVRERSQAQGAIVIILNGEHGSGFAVQADAAATLALPRLLENLARQIRADLT